MDRIRKLRLELRVKSQDVASNIGLHPQYYSSIETGYVFPKDDEPIKQRALKYLKPLLVKKLIDAQEEVERLESLITQYKN